jgi:hypothetical protein
MPSILPSNPDVRRQLKSRPLAMTPRAFELFAGDLLVYVGLRNVAVTRYVGDGGIDARGDLTTSADLISIPTGVQVKRYRSNVQRSDIDRFIGALVGQYAQGIFITTAGYAQQARMKAESSIPRVATVDGDQIVSLMRRHDLGISPSTDQSDQLDENYFADFEAQAGSGPSRLGETRETYLTEQESGGTTDVQPEDDLISLRALSYTLRIDTTTIRNWIERGKLQPDRYPELASREGFFFRRDRIAQIRHQFLTSDRPTSGSEWRQEFLDFARSRNLTKSYKPVLIKVLLKLVNRNGEVRIDDLVREFKAFYVQRQEANLPVEFGVPLLDDPQAVSDNQIKQLIVKNPLDRFLIKGFLEYSVQDGIVRFAPQLWSELRFYELLDVQQSADEQLRYYYGRR